MEITRITGTVPDPVAHVTEEKQLRGTDATNAVQAVKKEDESRRYRPPLHDTQNFDHLHDDPLQLLVRAVGARLADVFAVTSAARPLPAGLENSLTPEVAAARILRMLATARDFYRAQPGDSGSRLTPDAFRATADTAISRGVGETHDVLRNLGMLDPTVAAAIDRAHELIRQALVHFFE